MSESGEDSVVEEARPALPEARLLNYLGRVNTPTRVRKVAAIGVGVMGLIFLGLAVFFLQSAWKVFWRWYTPGNIVEALKFAVRVSRFELFIASFLGMVGVGQWLLCRPVYRGSAAACYLALLGVILGILVGVCIAIYWGFLAIDSAVPLWRMARSILLAAEQATVCLGACVALAVMKDLWAYLVWIAKQPSAEKPAVAFLPGKPGGKGA